MCFKVRWWILGCMYTSAPSLYNLGEAVCGVSVGPSFNHFANDSKLARIGKLGPAEARHFQHFQDDATSGLILSRLRRYSGRSYGKSMDCPTSSLRRPHNYQFKQPCPFSPFLLI
jgi:hypothetical protein